MNLGLARKVMVAANLADGDIGVHPDDPTRHYFEAKKFLERHDLRLQVCGDLKMGACVLACEQELLLSLVVPVVRRLIEELEGA